MGIQEEINVSELLRKIEQYNITAYAIAKSTGYSSNGIQKIIDGITKKPSRKTIISINDFIKNEYEGSKSCRTEEKKLDIEFKNLSVDDKLNFLYSQNVRLEEELRLSHLINRTYLRSITKHLNIKQVDELKDLQSMEDDMKKISSN